MFVPRQEVGNYQYLQIAENRREGKRVKQTIIATLGRLEQAHRVRGPSDQLLRSAARFAEHIMVLAQHASSAHDAPAPRPVYRTGTGLRTIVARHRAAKRWCASSWPHATIASMSNARCYMTCCIGLMVSGSDRSALRWRRDQAIEGTAQLELQHLYRAMGWLGEAAR